MSEKVCQTKTVSLPMLEGTFQVKIQLFSIIQESFDTLEPLYSLTSQMYLMFKSNNWGQAQGFSARFTSLPPVCGDDLTFEDQSLSIQSPKLSPNGIYRRGYLSCRYWTLVQLDPRTSFKVGNYCQSKSFYLCKLPRLQFESY